MATFQVNEIKRQTTGQTERVQIMLTLKEKIMQAI